jgi:uncharacterized membrane protein YbhN (UPF0104 family)
VGGVFARLRAFGRRHRAITVLGSLATAAALVLVLAGRGHELETALWSAAPWMLALTALLQIVALVARSEAWHLTIEAAGGTVDRRVLYCASSMQVGQPVQRAAGGRDPDRGAATLVARRQSAGTDADCR